MSQPNATPAGSTTDLDAFAASLEQGIGVVLPTETVYGVFERWSGEPNVAWHAPSGDAILAHVRPKLGVVERAIRKLLSMPVTLEITPDLIETLPTMPALQPGEPLLLRVPEPVATRTVLSTALERGVFVAARSLSAIGLTGDIAPSIDAARDAINAQTLVLDDGPPTLGRGSARVRIDANGLWVVPDGPVDERQVRERLKRSILFVCTGNTCRSPMAEAIAATRLRDEDPTGTTLIGSAGVSAMPGSPPTFEAVEALRSMGLEPTSSGSRRLTHEMAREADVIFGLTRDHVDMIRELVPSEQHKVGLLDPEGADVPDPIGGPQDVYDATAASLGRLIEQRWPQILGVSEPGGPI